VNPGCQPLCEKIVGAECENGPTMEGCLLTCKVLTSDASCDDLADVYFDCVADGEVTCNGAGDPVAMGCGLAYLEAIGCAVNSNPNPEVVEPCTAYCDKMEEAACPNNDIDNCETNCRWAGATGTGCDDEWITFLECANDANWSCILGFGAAEGCGSDYLDYTACIDAAGGG
jgi:hypothetical protein